MNKMVKKLALFIFSVVKKIIDFAIGILRSLFRSRFIRIVFILICAFRLYLWLFPSIEMQLFSGVEKHCKNQESCQIHLHEIMPFKWDKAYFFLEENGYSSEDIQKITGIKGDFHLGRRDVLALFKYYNHLVKYDIYQVYDHSDLEFSFLNWGINKTFAIGFMMNKSGLNKLHYSGDINQFNDTVYIKYYEIMPQNDLLDAGCNTDTYFQGTIKTCLISFTNLEQVKLEMPKIIKEK